MERVMGRGKTRWERDGIFPRRAHCVLNFHVANTSQSGDTKTSVCGLELKGTRLSAAAAASQQEDHDNDIGHRQYSTAKVDQEYCQPRMYFHLSLTAICQHVSTGRQASLTTPLISFFCLPASLILHRPPPPSTFAQPILPRR